MTWEGPGNATDYIVLVPAGSDNATSGNYAYVNRGRELRIATPAEPGDYELRYLSGSQRLVLGARPLTILPRPLPGQLSVVATRIGEPLLDGATVAVILDASGSMLQRIDGQRRIDIAKAAVAGRGVCNRRAHAPGDICRMGAAR